MQKQYKIYLEDILGASEKIEIYVRGLTYEEFTKNSLVVDGVIRNLAIIGEAVKSIPSEIKKKHTDIEWKKVAGLRDIIVHKYSEVNTKIIWDIVENKLPELKKSIKKVIEEIKLSQNEKLKDNEGTA